MTQEQKILTLMIRRRSQEWFLPQDFMKSFLGDLFVGYEASARLSRLNSKYPFLFESRWEGKQIVRRFRFENINEILERCPVELVIFLRNELKISLEPIQV